MLTRRLCENFVEERIKAFLVIDIYGNYVIISIHAIMVIGLLINCKYYIFSKHNGFQNVYYMKQKLT